MKRLVCCLFASYILRFAGSYPLLKVWAAMPQLFVPCDVFMHTHSVPPQTAPLSSFDFPYYARIDATGAQEGLKIRAMVYGC